MAGSTEMLKQDTSTWLGRVSVQTDTRPMRFAQCMIVLVACAFVLLRFVNLEADPPDDLTSSGSILTDEGWYSNAAVRWVRGQKWYEDGGFNPAVSMPMFHVLQALVFSTFGVSLMAARVLGVTTCVLTIWMVYCLVTWERSRWPALVVALLLALDYKYFCFSRLAMLEVPMVSAVVAAMLTMWRDFGRFGGVRCMIAGVLIAVAVLTKSSGIFSVPVIMYTVLTNTGSPLTRVGRCSLFLGTLVVIVGGYHWFAKAAYPRDYAYFVELNIASRSIPSFETWVRNAISLVLAEPFVGLVSLLVGMCATMLFILVPEVRKNRLFSCLLVWWYSYGALLSLVNYHPVRYYLPCLIPMSILMVDVARCCFIASRRARPVMVVVIAVAMAVAGRNAGPVLRYSLAPTFSFREMADDVGRRIAKTGKSEGLVFSHFADSLNLVAPVQAANLFGTAPLATRMDQAEPIFLVESNNQPEFVGDAVEEYGKRQELVRYENVLGGRFGPIILSKCNQSPPAANPQHGY